MKIARVLIFMAIAFSTAASAQTSPSDRPQRKYCGSGFTEKLVPEAPFGCQMSQACKAHDVCYSKCDKGGELVDTPYCKNSEFSAVRLEAKLACEANFYKDIAKANDGRWVCKGVGALYVAAVTIVGQGPFNGRELPLTAMEEMVLASNSIDEIKFKTIKIVDLSQKGLIDLQQMRRVQDRIEFIPVLREGLPVSPNYEFRKGIDLKDLKLQVQRAGE